MDDARPLTPPRTSRMTWAARAQRAGPIVVKIRHGDGAYGTQVAGDDGLRCLVSYRAIAGLAHFASERRAYGDSLADAECAAVSAILDRLQATGSA